jgi:nucleoside-diphosphate-sugar epimerase
MNIAVIGGAGFVGSALVRELVKRDHKVVVYDNGSRGKNVTDSAVTIWTDGRLMPALEGFDMVYDFAARVYGVRDLYKDPAELLADNIAITIGVLKAVVAGKVPNYFYVSSSCVYDFPGAKVPHKEDDTNICDTSYGFSKLAGEQLVKWYARQYGFVAKIARLFHVYGPGDSFQSPHVIPEFIKKAEEAKSTGKFAILGSGMQTRDFTYMDDVVEGLLTIAERGAHLEAYNIGTGREVSIRDLAEMVCYQHGLYLGDLVGFHDPVAPQDIQRRAADNSKLRALGWEPKVTLEEGLRRLIVAPVPA